MEMTKTGWMATAAAVAAGGALLWSRQMRMGVRLTPMHELAFERTHEVARLHHPGRALAGAAVVALGGLLVSRLARNDSWRHGYGMQSSTVEESIEVDVPVSTAYNQWTQFEEFPRFMATVEEVRQLDDKRLHWKANVAGKVKEWDAEITEQIPDKRIAWRSIGGVQNAGVVTFHKISENRTRVMLQMDYEPETAAEKVGDTLGGVKLTTKGNLRKFKDLVEARGVETGAWRGTIPQN